MTIKERYDTSIRYFSEKYPDAATELHYENPYQLLVAVMLSAQCTDKRVNQVTPGFFRAFPNITSLAGSDFETVFPLIKSISYPNSKARHLLGTAQMLLNDFKGITPMNVEALMRLPGVGRKTANVMTSVLDNQPNMPVDTHVFRVSGRIGLTIHSKNPLETEKQLVKHLPDKLIPKFHHWLILHGRYICVARKPKCELCGLQEVCKYYQKYVKKD